jgi:hypothetical protein
MALLKKTLNEEIRESRLKLREIYGKYKTELFTVVTKIDNMLELLEIKEERYEDKEE